MQTILQYLRPGHTLYDMCCDHGLMGLEALNAMATPKVVFNDRSEAALLAVRSSIASFDSTKQDRCRVVCSPAEECPVGEEASDFILAGVGVWTIISVIKALFPHGLGPHRLILSPQQKSLPLRSYLKERGLGLVDETVVVEQGRFREVIVMEAQGEIVDLYGQRIASRHDPESRAFVKDLKEYYERVAKAVGK